MDNKFNYLQYDMYCLFMAYVLTLNLMVIAMKFKGCAV